MPRFDVQQQQSVIDAALAPSNAFGSGAGTAAIGQAIGKVADAGNQALQKAKEKEEKDERIRLSKDLSASSIKFTQRQQELEQEYPDGEGLLEAFDQEISKHNKEMLGSYSKELQQEAELKFFQVENQLKTRVIAKQAALKSQAQIADFESDRDVFVAEVSSNEMDEGLALTLLNDRVKEMTANPSIRGALKQENEDLIGSAAVTRILDEQGVIAADKALNAAKYKGLSPALRDRLKGKVKAKASVHVRDSLSEASQMFSAGYPVPDLDSELAIANHFGLKEQAADISFINSTADKVNRVVLQPLSKSMESLQKLDAKLLSGEGTSKDLATMKALTTAINTKQTMLNKDPYTWVSRSGYWPEPVLDVDVLVDSTEALNQRRSIQHHIKQNEGIDVPLLSSTDAKALTGAIEQASPEQKIDILDNMTKQLLPGEIGMVAGSLGVDSPHVAAAMVNSVHNKPIARDILLGADRDIPEPKKDEYSAAFMESTGLAIEDEQARQQALGAAKALYRERMFKANKASDILDGDEFEKAVQDVVGPVVEVGEGKTLSFRDQSGEYLTEDDFDDLIDEIDSEAIQATHGDIPRSANGEPLDVQRMFKRLRLAPVGDAVYYLKNEEGQFAMTEGGRPFELNMRALNDHVLRQP